MAPKLSARERLIEFLKTRTAAKAFVVGILYSAFLYWLVGEPYQLFGALAGILVTLIIIYKEFFVTIIEENRPRKRD